MPHYVAYTKMEVSAEPLLPEHTSRDKDENSGQNLGHLLAQNDKKNPAVSNTEYSVNVLKFLTLSSPAKKAVTNRPDPDQKEAYNLNVQVLFVLF